LLCKKCIVAKPKEVKNLLRKAMAQKRLFSSDDDDDDDDDDYATIFPTEYMGNILVTYEAI
jgi:hypothetical protein